MKVFILEDDQSRIEIFGEALKRHDLTTARTYEEAIYKWNPPYDIVCLDHDLGGHIFVPSDGEEKTGYSFVEWLRQKYTENNFSILIPVDVIFIHSFNPDGARRMAEALDSGVRSYSIYIEPFGRGLIKAIQYKENSYESHKDSL